MLKSFSKNVSNFSYKIIEDPGLRGDNRLLKTKFYNKLIKENDSLTGMGSLEKSN